MMAYDLKHRLQSKWVRFHSLPDSKRWPGNEADEAIIRERHNAVLSSLWGNDADIAVIDSILTDAPEPSPSDIPRGREYWASVKVEPDFPEGAYCHYCWAAKTWHPGLLDDAITLAAHDRLSDMIVINPAERVTYHPYDGGMDLIILDDLKRTAVREEFKGWLSKHPTGL